MYIPKSLLVFSMVSGALFVAGVVMLTMSFTGAAAADGTVEAAAPPTAVELCSTEQTGSDGVATLVAAMQAMGFTADDDDDGEGDEDYQERGDYATNSGTIDDSLFTDGGFGDIGQQWREVEVHAPVTNVNVTGDGAKADVRIGDEVTVPTPPTQPTAPTPPPEVVSPTPPPAPSPPTDAVAPPAPRPTVPTAPSEPTLVSGSSVPSLGAAPASPVDAASSTT
jgi:hypothetical protein